jgi:hypothetical protein
VPFLIAVTTNAVSLRSLYHQSIARTIAVGVCAGNVSSRKLQAGVEL